MKMIESKAKWSNKVFEELKAGQQEVSVVDFMKGGYKELLEKKIKEWNRIFPQVQFDEYGRAELGNIQIPRDVIFNNVSGQIDDMQRRGSLFDLYLTRVLREKYEACSPLYADRSIIKRAMKHDELYISTRRGREEKVKASKWFAKAQELWENDNPRYTEIMDKLRVLRPKINKTESEKTEIERLLAEKEEIESLNIYVMYQRLQNEAKKGGSLKITINPLDTLVASGDGRVNPTKFSTCWSTEFKPKKNKDGEDLLVVMEGGYSNPIMLLAYGSLLGKAIVYVENGIDYTIEHKDIPHTNNKFTFKGFTERGHVLIADEDKKKVLVERWYPSKSEERENEVIKIMAGKGMERETYRKKQLPYQDMEGNLVYTSILGKYKYYRKEMAKSYSSIYLDRVGFGESEKKDEKELPVIWGLRGNRIDEGVHSNTDSYAGGTSDLATDVIVCECGHVHNANNERLEQVEGCWYCGECKNELFTTCPTCGRVHNEEDLIKVGDRVFCADCKDKYIKVCSACGESHLIDNCICINKEEDLYLCKACEVKGEDIFDVCEICGEKHLKRDLDKLIVDGVETKVCSLCYFELEDCKECNEYTRNSDCVCNKCKGIEEMTLREVAVGVVGMIDNLKNQIAELEANPVNAEIRAKIEELKVKVAELESNN